MSMMEEKDSMYIITFISHGILLKKTEYNDSQAAKRGNKDLFSCNFNTFEDISVYEVPLESTQGANFNHDGYSLCKLANLHIMGH